jgi:hypothetical protein
MLSWRRHTLSWSLRRSTERRFNRLGVPLLCMEHETIDHQSSFDRGNEVVQEFPMSRLVLGWNSVEVNDGAKLLVGGSPIILMFKPTPGLVVELLFRPDDAIGVGLTNRWAPFVGLLQVADLCPMGVDGMEVPAPTSGDGMVAFEPKNGGTHRG